MLTLIETGKESNVTRMIQREREVIADQYDRLKTAIKSTAYEDLDDLIDEAKHYHCNRVAMFGEVMRGKK